MKRSRTKGLRSSRRSDAPALAATGPTVTIEPPTNGYFLSGSDHQAAADSPLRGYIYWRSTNTRKQISDYTDAEIQRRLDFLYNHSGICRRLVNGMAMLCGILAPQPNTVNDVWNEEAFDAFQFSASSPEIFDAGGRFDFYGAQIVTNANRFRAGRSLGVLTETPAGRARIAFYDPWQIDHKHRGQSPAGIDPKKIVRGVEMNKFTRHLAYYLKDAENPDAKPTRIPAKNALYFGKFDNHGQVHPMSILAGAVVNLIDVAETRSSWKAQIKSAGRRGEVIEQDPVQNHVHAMGGVGAAPVKVEITQPDGSTRTVAVEQVYGDGTQITKLNPGERLKLITDDRPSANNLEFDRLIVEDCAFFANLPPEALFRIAGITGPGIRYHMEWIDRWILLEHLWQSRWCHRFYTYTIAKEIKAGRLAEPLDASGNPIPWWRPSQCLWIGLPSLTIDHGNRGKISITRLDAGLTTWADEWGALGGAFWKKKISARVSEVAFAKLRTWEESQRLLAATEGQVGLDAAEVFKFATFGGASSASADAAALAELEGRVEDIERPYPDDEADQAGAGEDPEN